MSFTDGTAGVVDLEELVETSMGVLAALRDPAFFRLASVDQEAGTVTWPNGVDLDPDVLYRSAHSG